MCMYIGIEDFAANALIRILSLGRTVPQQRMFIPHQVVLLDNTILSKFFEAA